ncbi:MAG: excinuclease ABC subunit UvrC [Christensenellales bacterium]|jgi:excinuclease ABC subunit C
MFELTPEKYRESLSQKLKELPDSPGVYLHKDESGNIIYVGKAVSLKNRGRQYFQSPKNHSPKVRALVSRIADFSYVMVDSETEALTLECNFIKRYRPFYNVLLKDDKSFPYVRIDMNAPYPRVEIVNNVKNDGARYFGPYLSRSAVREALAAVSDNFALRTCKKDIERSIARGERPCLYYHLGKCSAPCANHISKEEYRKIVDQVACFLSGQTEEVIASLTAQMNEAAADLAFERAAAIRDRIESVRIISEKQKAAMANVDERDILALCRSKDAALVYALFVRGGKVIGAERYDLLCEDEDDGEALSAFLTQFYSTAPVPPEIVLNRTIENSEAMARWLSEQRGKKAVLTFPKRGNKKKLCEMAERNGMAELQKDERKRRRLWERTRGALISLASVIGIDVPERIECFDISHTMGVEPVASMVVFAGGKPDPSQYRRFKIKHSGNDDYAAMGEVLSRRFARFKADREKGESTGFAAEPGLLLIDGGKGQLRVAMDELQKAGLAFPVAGLSERLEELWLPGRSDPVVLKTGSPELHMLQRVRDEAHRFAITYHRSLRNKASLASALEEIKGVGPVRRRALLSAFPSPESIKNATLEELAAAPGVDKRTARLVYESFHGQQGDTAENQKQSESGSTEEQEQNE